MVVASFRPTEGSGEILFENMLSFVEDLFTRGECFRKLRSRFRFASLEMTSCVFIFSQK